MDGRQKDIGILEIFEQVKSRVYTSNEIRLAESLASQGAVAIENSLLYKNANDEIHRRKLSEEVLRESEGRYRTLVETNPYGIQEIDTTGIIIYTNSTYQKMLGYTKEELSGESILNLLEPTSKRDELREYLTVLVKEQPQLTSVDPETPKFSHVQWTKIW